MNELDRAKELMEAWKRQELPAGPSGDGLPSVGDNLLLSQASQILADLIALCERQQAELGQLRFFRDNHIPISQPVYSQPHVFVKDCDASVSDGDTGDDDD